MNSEFPFPLYYLGLFIATIFLTKFIFNNYINFAKRYYLNNSNSSRTTYKVNKLTGGGVVFASVVMVSSLVLENLDFVEFSNFSPILATSVLISVLGFYNDLIKISLFSKSIILIFLILMLLYSNSNLPLIRNLYGCLEINNIGFISGLIFTSFVYFVIMKAVNVINGISSYLEIFSIFFFTSLLYNFSINEFYTLNSISVIIIGCSVVFLRYSFFRSKKLFLGDSGSLFIGFWIATYLITYITSASNSRLVDVYSINLENIPIIAISMISIPTLDVIRVIVIRIINKKPLFTADRNHLHHILIDRGMTNLRTSLFLTAINWFNCIMIFLMEQNFNSKQLIIIYIVINLFWCFFFEYLKRKLNSSKG